MISPFRFARPSTHRLIELTVVASLLVSVLGVLGVTTPVSAAVSGKTKPFRLLGPSTTVGGLERPALLQAVLFSRITASKKTQEAKDCSARPQVEDAPKLFVLPGQPGKRLSCTVERGVVVLIDHNGAICNDSKKTKADAACVQSRLDQITGYSVTVDGINLGAGRFKTLSDAFVVTTKADNPFGFAPGKWKIMAGGWPVSIDQLSPGLHEIVTTYQIGDLSRQTIRVDLTVTA